MPKQIRPVQAGPYQVGPGHPWLLIAGPCVIESEEHALMLARSLAAQAAEAGANYVFKASFDKANRSSVSSYRGPGLTEGLRILRRVRDEAGVPVLTDIHEPAQAGPVGEVCDIVQIPAFLCRQTDLLLEAGRHARCVNVKKGQFLAPLDMRNVVEKIHSTGNANLLLTERGSSFGYNNLVVDMRALPLMRSLGVPVIFDATHSVQLPGAQGNASGGQPQFIPGLARAAMAMGVDGIFFEVHENPAAALSDGANALRLDGVPQLLRALQSIRAVLTAEAQ